MQKSEYRIYINDELFVRATWPPIAVAGWHRAVRDTAAGREGGSAVLLKDGREIAATRNDSFRGDQWPDGDEPGLNDAAGAILLLARAAGIGQRELADAMTESGLPTTRGRLDSIRSKPGPGRSQTSAAELVAMCYAAVGKLRDKS